MRSPGHPPRGSEFQDRYRAQPSPGDPLCAAPRFRRAPSRLLSARLNRDPTDTAQFLELHPGLVFRAREPLSRALWYRPAERMRVWKEIREEKFFSPYKLERN